MTSRSWWVQLRDELQSQQQHEAWFSTAAPLTLTPSKLLRRTARIRVASGQHRESDEAPLSQGAFCPSGAICRENIVQLRQEALPCLFPPNPSRQVPQLRGAGDVYDELNSHPYAAWRCRPSARKSDMAQLESQLQPSKFGPGII